MEYFTPEEIAQMLKVDVSTIWRWLREGKLLGLKIGKAYRVSQEQLDRFLKARETGQKDAPEQ